MSEYFTAGIAVYFRKNFNITPLRCAPVPAAFNHRTAIVAYCTAKWQTGWTPRPHHSDNACRWIGFRIRPRPHDGFGPGGEGRYRFFGIPRVLPLSGMISAVSPALRRSASFRLAGW